MFMYVFFIFLFFLSRMHVSYFVCVFENSIKKLKKKKKKEASLVARPRKCLGIQGHFNISY